MKKFLLALVAFAWLAPVAHADGFADPLVTSLITHVHTQTVFDVSGRTRLELTDAIIQALPAHGAYIAEIQAGFSGLSTPQPGEPQYANFVASLSLRVDPYLKNVIYIPEQYSFLRAVEFGPVYGYDFREHHGYLGLQANLAFGLNPIQ